MTSISSSSSSFSTNNSKNTQIIVFEGIIGAGKSTTIDYVSNYLRNILGYSVYVVKENVDEWVKDGILELFYGDSKRYSYHFQTKVFMDKVMGFRKVYEEYYNKVDFIICERSLISDYIFASILKSEGNMTDMEFKHYNQWYNMWKEFVPKQFQNYKNVYLKIDVNTAMQRIKQRNRDGETSITYNYQSHLEELHNQYFDNNNNIIWDSSRDISDVSNIDELCHQIIS